MNEGEVLRNLSAVKLALSLPLLLTANPAFAKTDHAKCYCEGGGITYLISPLAWQPSDALMVFRSAT